MKLLLIFVQSSMFQHFKKILKKMYIHIERQQNVVVYRYLANVNTG